MLDKDGKLSHHAMALFVDLTEHILLKIIKSKIYTILFWDQFY